MKENRYIWYPDTKCSKCIITYNHQEFEGLAICHPDDEDLVSEHTGQLIAEMRASIKVLTHIRDNELRPQLKALYQLYYSMKHSKQFNSKSYESIMLYKHIRSLENDLDITRKKLVGLKQGLKDYIDEKEKLYQRIRKKRAVKIEQIKTEEN